MSGRCRPGEVYQDEDGETYHVVKAESMSRGVILYRASDGIWAGHWPPQGAKRVFSPGPWLDLQPGHFYQVAGTGDGSPGKWFCYYGSSDKGKWMISDKGVVMSVADFVSFLAEWHMRAAEFVAEREKEL